MAKLKKTIDLTTENKTLAEWQDTDVTVTEINKLDGITSTTAQLNYLDSLTSSPLTQLQQQRFSSNQVDKTGVTDFSTNSSSFVHLTGSDAAITLTAQSSRVLYIMKFTPHVNMLTLTHRTGAIQVHRGGSALAASGHTIRGNLATSHYSDQSETLAHVDHPDTTTAVTYSCYGLTQQNTNIVYLTHSLFQSQKMKIAIFELDDNGSTSWN